MGGFKNRACIFPLYPNHTTYNIYIHIYIYYVNHIPDKPDKSIVTCRGPQMPNIFSRMVETSWDDGSSIISRFPSCRHLFGGCYTYISPFLDTLSWKGGKIHCSSLSIYDYTSTASTPSTAPSIFSWRVNSYWIYGCSFPTGWLIRQRGPLSESGSLCDNRWFTKETHLFWYR
jgi:hypothetical protein